LNVETGRAGTRREDAKRAYNQVQAAEIESKEYMRNLRINTKLIH
jgi:hypothetical protein